MDRFRHFVFTDFAKDEGFWAKLKPQIKFLVAGDEICPTTGRPHWQGYFYTNMGNTITCMRKKLEGRYCASMYSCPESCIKYCEKDAKLALKWGEPPSQGKRTDLIEMKDNLMSGELKVDDILENNPMAYHQYGRTLQALEDLRMSRQYRMSKDICECIWYFGGTGVGKSHLAFEGFTPATHYVWVNDNGWWDNYKQQETVIFNDFRGEVPYNEMLQMIDKFPYSVKRRGRCPIPFVSKRVIITSSLPPDLIYKHRMAEDSIEQFWRRVSIRELRRDGTEVVRSNIELLTRNLASLNL